MSWLAILSIAVGAPLAAFMLCWGLYVTVMKLMAYHNETACAPCKDVVMTIAIPLAIVTWLIDVALNYTLFMVLGKTDRLTVSSRLKDLRRNGTTGWRRFVANFVCERMLNPHDEGHC